jgi:hypothetical protein|eukprot:COSAG01_NODE_9530_length_2415_cov_8.203624_2_plen_64_part_00
MMGGDDDDGEAPSLETQEGSSEDLLHLPSAACDKDAINIPASSSDSLHRPKLHYFMTNNYTTL